MTTTTTDKIPLPTFDAALWGSWLLATTLGWIAGWAIGGEAFVGVGTGLLQWIVLRPRLRQAGWWIVASTGGWIVGWTLAILLLPPENTLLAGALIGLTTGIAQWIYLRREVALAAWWILVSALSWDLGLLALFGAPLIGAVSGAGTGIAIELLLRYHEYRQARLALARAEKKKTP